MRKMEDLTGKVFGTWKVVSRGHKTVRGMYLINVVCKECNFARDMHLSNLKSPRPARCSMCGSSGDGPAESFVEATARAVILTLHGKPVRMGNMRVLQLVSTLTMGELVECRNNPGALRAWGRTDTDFQELTIQWDLLDSAFNNPSIMNAEDIAARTESLPTSLAPIVEAYEPTQDQYLRIRKSERAWLDDPENSSLANKVCPPQLVAWAESMPEGTDFNAIEWRFSPAPGEDLFAYWTIPETHVRPSNNIIADDEGKLPLTAYEPAPLSVTPKSPELDDF